MKLCNIRHLVVDYDKSRYCGHPRQCGIANFGNGEIAVLYRRAPCAYQTEKDVSHRPSDGYMSRSDYVLRRSRDHGETWPEENDVIVFSNAMPLEEKLAFLRQDPATRQPLDMSRPGAMFFFGFTSISTRDPVNGRLVRADPAISGAFQVRSVDKGRTWESVPLPLQSWGYPPQAILADGTHARNIGSGQIYLSTSKDHGMSWQRGAKICNATTEQDRMTYTGLLALPGGRLQCYGLLFGTPFHGLCVCETDDLMNWTPPRPIVRFGHGPWTARKWTQETYRLRTAYGGWGQRHRSPWPLRLRDGRIVIVFARREYPPSIAAIWSEDNGQTWSDEAIIRDDAEGSDMGYPVATELDDGRIFAAYYFQRADGNPYGGTRFIGGSFFELP